MGRHSVDATSADSGDDAGQPRDPSEYGGYAAPPSRRGPRVAVAIGVAIVGIILLVFGIISLNSAPADPRSTDSANTSAAETDGASETQGQITESTTPDPGTTLGPASPAVLPVTVLNNSRVVGLASRVAAQLAAGGWPIAELLNYSRSQLSATTAFFTPGNAAEEAAAQALVIQFPQISGGAQPRLAGLPGAGLTVAAVGDWLP